MKNMNKYECSMVFVIQILFIRFHLMKIETDKLFIC